LRTHIRYMRQLFRYLTLFIFILHGNAAKHLSAQELRFRNDLITRENGLSGSTVSSIARDKYGFIWIGTWNGLNRYDGYEMTVFQSDPYDTFSISNNNINSIFEDTEGTIWVSTDNGLNSYDQVTGKFTRHYFNASGTAGQRDNQINGVTQDANGQIWIGTQQDGLVSLNKSSSVFRKFYNDFSDRSNTIYAVHADNLNEHYIWLGTADGLFRYNQSTGIFERKTTGLQDASISIQVIRQDAKGDLYMGTWGNGLIKFDRKSVSLSVCYTTSEDGNAGRGVIRALEFDSRGNLMFIVRDIGLMQYNLISGIITQQNLGEINNQLNTNVVTSMYIEPSGIIWIGTHHDGALKLVNLINKFWFYTPFPEQNSRNNGGGVSAIIEDSDAKLWLGTRYGGISVINRRTLVRKFYSQSANGLSSNNILSMLETTVNGRKTIWIGTDGGGLNKLDVATGMFTVYRSESGKSGGLNSNSVSSIISYDNDHLLIGTRDRNLGEGLHVFNMNTGRFINLRYDENDSLSLGNNNILKLFKDKSGTVWVGTRNGGLNKFVIKNINAEKPSDIGYFIRYTYDPSNPLSLGNNTIYAIHDDSRKNLWLGTNQGGLTRFEPSTGAFHSQIMGQYVKGQIIYGILADDYENLWISTSRGIINLNLATNDVHSFDKYDGLQETAFIYGSYFRSASGEMFFGGVRGCNSFHPDSISLNIKVPPIVITSLNFSGRKGTFSVSEITGKSVLASKTVKMPYYQNNFSLTFSALDYQMPAKNRFRYILDGYDLEPIETDAKRRYVNYTNLPPGKYIFRVMGSNSDDIWNHTGTSVTIVITPPFWNTTVFYFILVCIISGIILFFFYLVFKKHKLEKAMLEMEAISSVQDERKQLRTLIDNIPDLIFIKDRQSRFTLANNKVAAIMGTTPEDLIGKTDFDFYSPEIARVFFDDEQKIMETCIPLINFEETAHDDNGNRTIRSTTKVPVKNKDGVIIGIAGVCRDITKLKKIENQLRKKSDDLLETNRLLEGRQKEILMQSEALALQTQNLMMINTELDRLNRTKDKFFSIIAHDLRNPFNAIIGFCELLRTDFSDMDDHQKLNLLELINISSQTAYNLLENLLQWARTQTDKINYDPVEFNLSESVKAVMDLHCVTARKKGVKLKNQIDNKTLVYADKNMISTVLRNLVSNAIKFSNPNGDIIVSSNLKTDMVEVHVADSGIGMNRESLTKLFRIDTYYSTAGTMGESGTGLGLIICKEFVEKNSGRIKASSSEGSGTTVSFTLNPGKNGHANYTT
jgi:PAS domain S-box-containing protein